jgi:hypothetical protein
VLYVFLPRTVRQSKFDVELMPDEHCQEVHIVDKERERESPTYEELETKIQEVITCPSTMLSVILTPRSSLKVNDMGIKLLENS